MLLPIFFSSDKVIVLFNESPKIGDEALGSEQTSETKKAEIIAAKEAEEAKKRARAERFGMAGGDEGPTKKAKM